MLRYSHVYFDTGGFKNGKPDVDDYYYICTEDLRKKHYAQVVTYPLDYFKSSVIHKLFVISNRMAIKYGIGFLEKLFYPWYFKKSKTEKPYCFILSGFYITPGYVRYLKKRYPDCKIAKIYRDSYVLWRQRNKHFSDEDMRMFDMNFSYDIGESEKFNMIHFNEIESITEVERANSYPLYDVFFAGAAKDRLPLLVSFYDYLEQRGLNCFFFITNAKNEEQIERKGIHYSDKGMSYREMLYYTVNSEVILEINQGIVDGFTSRFLEAVMYNKKLITNNPAVKDNRYYDSRFIKCVTNPDDIDIDFIKEPIEVDFHYQDEFSPTHLIDLIDKSLVDKFGEPMVFSK